MILILQIWFALGIDFLLGDPRRIPHPVKFIGALAKKLEGPFRLWFVSVKLAGIGAAIAVIGISAIVPLLCLALAAVVAPWVEFLTGIVILWTTFAARDLARHGKWVQEALNRGDLAAARMRVSWIVGRDTAAMDEKDIIRATVESIAENTVDGIIAPLFFAFLGGPVMAMAYKAVSTLDSTFGYRNATYTEFGWASARMDDLANYIPARLGAFFMVLAAWGLQRDFRSCLRVCLRDGRKHSSPNAGVAEAAMAGALGVQLGGPVHRNGRLEQMPYFGQPIQPLERNHISMACRLMIGTTFIGGLIFSLVRLIIWIIRIG